MSEDGDRYGGSPFVTGGRSYRGGNVYTGGDLYTGGAMPRVPALVGLGNMISDAFSLKPMAMLLSFSILIIILILIILYFPAFLRSWPNSMMYFMQWAVPIMTVALTTVILYATTAYGMAKRPGGSLSNGEVLTFSDLLMFR